MAFNKFFPLIFLLLAARLAAQQQVIWLAPNHDASAGSYTCENSTVEIRVMVTGEENVRREDFTVLLNGTPERGGKAEIGTISKNTFSKKIIVPLGSSDIIVQFLSKNGILRSPKLVVANYGKPNLHLLAFGTKPADLEFTDDDAEDVAAIFKTQEGKIFGKVNIEKLVKADASGYKMTQEIERCLTKFKLGDIHPVDVLVLFISTHGFLEEGKLYLQGDDFDGGAPLGTSVEFTRTLEIFSKINCKKIILLDACHSGGGRRNFKDLNEAIRTLAEAQPGLVVMTSSTAEQISHEDPVWKNGAFTEAFLSGLGGLADANRDHFITLEEIWNHLKTEVPKIVREVKNGIVQTPQRPRNELADLPFFALPGDVPPPDPLKIDSDGDGVLDFLDDCPQEQGEKSAAGCPDRDRDGLTDHLDICPDQAGVAKNKGCPESAEGFVWFEGGTFSQGSDAGEANERPVHPVKLDFFYLSPTEVSIADFSKFVKEKNYKTTAERKGWGWIFTGKWEKLPNANWRCDGQGNPVKPNEENLPVVFVSWLDALEYCNWLSQKNGLRPCYRILPEGAACDWSANGYRLPTEAEWEFAASSGGKKQAFAGTGLLEELHIWANFCDKNCPFSNRFDQQSDGFSMAAPVESLRPTAEGIHHLSGNVWEWCWDVFSEKYQPEFQSNPGRQDSGELGQVRSIRGGAWNVLPAQCRVFTRNSEEAGRAVFNIGFRVCRGL